MHLWRDFDTAVQIAVSVKATEKARNVRETGIKQLLDVPVHPADDARKVDTRRARSGANGNLPHSKHNTLSGAIVEFAPERW